MKDFKILISDPEDLSITYNCQNPKCIGNPISYDFETASMRCRKCGSLHSFFLCQSVPFANKIHPKKEKSGQKGEKKYKSTTAKNVKKEKEKKIKNIH
jgi:hypothetical protein